MSFRKKRWSNNYNKNMNIIEKINNIVIEETLGAVLTTVGVIFLFLLLSDCGMRS